ncbi:MAG TPA: nuclear transport factor 2 family protein [Bryobacteraceae bacterium]
MIDRAPGAMADTCVRLFGRGEAFDSEGFIGFFTDKPMYQFGNGEPCLTKEAIKASIDGFFSAVDALYHDVRNLWEVGDCVFVEMDVTYWRKDGTHIKLPCADILRFEGDKIQELRIFMDANPIFMRDMKVGDKASVMTISEGNRVKPGGAMKKFFSDHKEGIQRVKDGFIPKWHIAGPKWPIRSKRDIFLDFQNVFRAGKIQEAVGFLSDGAILRVGNRPEVTGPPAIMGALGKLFAEEIRPTNATFTGVWEPDESSLVIEMTLDATRVSDGKAIQYPCTETYRFEGHKIKEWRIYPIEATFLASESMVARS